MWLLQVVQSCGQIFSKWRHLLAKFATNASGAMSKSRNQFLGPLCHWQCLFGGFFEPISETNGRGMSYCRECITLWGKDMVQSPNQGNTKYVQAKTGQMVELMQNVLGTLITISSSTMYTYWLSIQPTTQALLASLSELVFLLLQKIWEMPYSATHNIWHVGLHTDSRHTWRFVLVLSSVSHRCCQVSPNHFSLLSSHSYVAS